MRKKELDEYAAAITQISKQIQSRRKLLKEQRKPSLDQMIYLYKSKSIKSINVFMGFILFPLTIMVTMVASTTETNYSFGRDPNIHIILYTVYFIIVRFYLSELRFIRPETVYYGCIYFAPLIADYNYWQLGSYWSWQDYFLLVIPPLLLSLAALINTNLMDKNFVKEAPPEILIQSLVNNNYTGSYIERILYKQEELLFLELTDLDDDRIRKDVRKNKEVLLTLICLAIRGPEYKVRAIIRGADPQALKNLAEDGYIEAIFRNNSEEDSYYYGIFVEAIENI